MRIILATDNFYPMISGQVVFTERIAFHLQRRGHAVLIIAPSKTLHQEAYTHKGIKVFGLPSFPILAYKNMYVSYPFVIKKLIKKAVMEFKPDVIHLQSPFVIARSILKVAKQLNIPIILTNHFLPENFVHHLHLPNFAEKWVKNQLWKKLCSFYEEFDVLTTPTKTAAQLIKSEGFSKKIHAISNGIDLKRFNPKNKGIYLKTKYGLPNKPILLYVGRIDKEKNINAILQALLLILKKVDIHFVIAGGMGEEEKNLKNLVKKLRLKQFVTFTGFVSDNDLPNLYMIADCFIIASTAELQSIATMEAMASGLPVIAANALALPELVKHNENGYLFKPNDIKSISKYVIRIMTNKNLQKKMGRRSFEIIKKHEIRKIIDQYETLYKSLIEK